MSDTSRYTFSPSQERGGATWVAGVIGAPQDQAIDAWAQATAALEHGALTPADVTEAVEYLTLDGLNRRDELDTARPSAIADVSTMVVDSLVRDYAFLEVEVVAGGPAHQTRLPQILPVDDAGEVIAPGDFVRQCDVVVELAVEELNRRGLDASNVVRVVQQTTPATRAQYGEAGAARAQLLGPVYPASTGVLSPALPVPGVLVALDVWASSEPKEVVNPGWDAFEALTFSPAVRAGDIVYISGTTAWDPATGQTVAPGDLSAQATFVYEQIGQICAAAGGSIDDLVKTIEYVSPSVAADYRAVADVRRTMLSEPYPVATGVFVSGLLSRKWVIEVEAVAIIPR